MSIYYSVHKGRNPGIYTSWLECSAQVSGFSGAKYKKFPSFELANEFFINGTSKSPQQQLSSSNIITIYTDGSSCDYKGGYACIFLYPDGRQEEKYGKIEGRCTNSRAELYAIMMAFMYSQILLENAPYPFTIRIFSDSDVSIKSLTEYLPKWKCSGWKKSSGEQISNIDLIQYLDQQMIELQKKHTIEFIHVPSHSGIVMNERADLLAEQGRLL